MSIATIFSVFLVLISSCQAINFDCWDESEQTRLTYSNNENKTIDSLPTVRLFMGYYGSQWAVQYTAYLYLKEKLGLNVTWFPSDQHYVLYDPANVGNGYPDFYFDWMVEDKYDLCLEIWPAQVLNASYV